MTGLNPNVQEIDWYATAGTLRSAFELSEREDGSEFWCFTELARQSTDDLATVVREWHDEELPNDWRYATIVNILDEIIEESKDESVEWGDMGGTIADRLTNTYTDELVQWLADNTKRLIYHDEAMQEGLISADLCLSQRLMIAQFCCIEQMVNQVLHQLDLI